MFAQKSSLTRVLGVVLIFLFLFGFNGRLFAQQQEADAHRDLFEMSIEELMEVEVFSASRQAQKKGELSVPVSVITAENIHYSGLTTIPEILQFTPGMDVLQYDRNTYAIGIRGLHGRYSNRILSLLDGRVADSPIYGGPEFFRLPLFLEDIERIEVVRGPGGAVWGANAFTGVDTLGWLASTTWNHFGDSYSQLRWGDKTDKWSWRISGGYEDRETSQDAIANDNFFSHDFSRNWRYDGKAVYRPSETTKWSMGLGYSHIEAGNFDAGGGTYSRELRRFETGRSFVRVDREFSDTSSGHLQWFGNFAVTKYPDALNTYASENDIEGQLNFFPADKHNVSIGGNLRWIHITSSAIGGDQGFTFRDGSADECLAGLFAIDRWKATNRLTVEGQIRGDWYSETQTDWSGRLTTLYTLNEQKQRILRFSAAKAFRAPLITQREGQKHTGTHFIPGLYWFNIIAPDDLRNEQTWSLEAGYSEQLSKWLILRTDLYYQRFEDLIGDRSMPDPLSAGRTLEILDNINGADSYGCEVELTAKTKVGKFSAWYALNEFHLDQSNQQVDAYLPASHKAGLTARIFLPYDSTLNMNYRYTSSTSGDHADLSGYTSPSSSHRFDIAVAKKLTSGNGELMLGVSNLFNRTNDPVEDPWKHSTPGRMFFARLHYSY